ncbi:MAG: hypothetical protein ACFFCI_17860 [Promethearchaeota archaeon]
MASMTEKEKEKQSRLLVFDFAKEFVSNISAILDVEEDWAWELLHDKFSLSNDTLTLKFRLKESIVEKEIKKLDKAQQTLDESLGMKKQSIPD